MLNYKAGGKGINDSRQLNVLSVVNLSFTFLGGSNGKILKKLLGEEKINFTFISTHSETRSSAIILNESNKSITSYFGNDPQISLTEAEEFKFKLDKMIQNCEMVVFSGSSPCEVTNSIFPFGIHGANPTYAANFDFKFKATNPKVETIDSTGSGDSFVAGIVYGWHKNLPFEESLIIASSLGAANSAKYEVCNVTLEEVNAIKDKIEVIPLGKKMRLIDVKPT